MKLISLITALLILSAPSAFAANAMSDAIPGDPYGPNNPAAEQPEMIAKRNVHAVMYEFTYNQQTLAITHAQVIGGYPSVDECRQNMTKVGVMVTGQLAEGEQLQLQCSGIKEPVPEENDDTPADDTPPKPKTPI